MHFDTTSGKWMYEDLATGQEYEWNTVANAWVPVADEEELKKQQAAYSIAGVDESVRAHRVMSLQLRMRLRLGETSCTLTCRLSLDADLVYLSAFGPT